MRRLKIRLAWECLVSFAIAYIGTSLIHMHYSACGSLFTTQTLMIASVTVYALESAVESILETRRKILKEELEELRKGSE